VASNLLISIGGVVGSLRLGQTVGLEGELRTRYDPFLLPPAPWVCRDLSLTVSFRDGEALENTEPARVIGTPSSLDIRARSFDARLVARDSGGGPSWDGTATCAADPFAFDTLLRVLWSAVLSRKGGLLVHACGVRTRGMGIVFPGKSGAGKTTLASKVRNPEDVLSDELVPVTRDDAGRWRAHPSPFWGGGRRGGTSLRSWPLGSVAFLRKGRTLSVSRMSPAEATQRLLGTVLCLERDPAVARDTLALAAQLCADMPAVEIGSAVETPATELLGSLDHAKPAAASTSPARETISEARSILRSGRPYAFVAKGTSMHPQLRAGDTLLVEATPRQDLEPGDLVLYWRPAATPEDDLLVCHRLVARVRRGGEVRVAAKGDRAGGIERFVDRRDAEILGKVTAVTRDGKARRLPGRLVKWSRLAGSLARSLVAGHAATREG